jgi:Dullard-like phosphatase family protein
MTEIFELVIFTASAQNYADKIIDHLDPEKKFFHHRLYRQHITYENKNTYYKDLSLLGRDLDKIIIVDNMSKNYKKHKENGIKIKTWKGDLYDDCLLSLSTKLKTISETKEDIRKILPILLK